MLHRRLAAAILATGGDVLFAGAKFPSASDDQEVQAGRVELEVRKAGGADLPAPARFVSAQQRSSG